jgi:hypothetical protein
MSESSKIVKEQGHSHFLPKDDNGVSASILSETLSMLHVYG